MQLIGFADYSILYFFPKNFYSAFFVCREGLEFHNGRLYESTGLYRKSELRIVRSRCALFLLVAPRTLPTCRPSHSSYLSPLAESKLDRTNTGHTSGAHVPHQTRHPIHLQVDVESGRVLKRYKEHYRFGEGCTILNNTVYRLT